MMGDESRGWRGCRGLAGALMVAAGLTGPAAQAALPPVEERQGAISDTLLELERAVVRQPASTAAADDAASPSGRVPVSGLVALLVACGLPLIWLVWRSGPWPGPFRRRAAPKRSGEGAVTPARAHIERVDELRSLPRAEFLEVVCKVFEKLGYQVRRLSTDRPGGLDAVATKGRDRAVISCQQDQAIVASATVQGFHGALLEQRAQRGFLVTPGMFSLPAQRWVADTPIELVDGTRFLELMRKAFLEQGMAEPTGGYPESERREFPRVDLTGSTWGEVPTRVLVIARDRSVEATTKNVGLGGLCFDAREELPRGSLLQVELGLPAPSHVVRAIARVVWTRPSVGAGPSGTGVSFFLIEDDAKQQIARLMKDVTTEPGEAKVWRVPWRRMAGEESVPL